MIFRQMDMGGCGSFAFGAKVKARRNGAGYGQTATTADAGPARPRRALGRKPRPRHARHRQPDHRLPRHAPEHDGRARLPGGRRLRVLRRRDPPPHRRAPSHVVRDDAPRGGRAQAAHPVADDGPGRRRLRQAEEGGGHLLHRQRQDVGQGGLAHQLRRTHPLHRSGDDGRGQGPTPRRLGSYACRLEAHGRDRGRNLGLDARRAIRSGRRGFPAGRTRHLRDRIRRRQDGRSMPGTSLGSAPQALGRKVQARRLPCWSDQTPPSANARDLRTSGAQRGQVLDPAAVSGREAGGRAAVGSIPPRCVARRWRPHRQVLPVLQRRCRSGRVRGRGALRRRLRIASIRFQRSDRLSRAPCARGSSSRSKSRTAAQRPPSVGFGRRGLLRQVHSRDLQGGVGRAALGARARIDGYRRHVRRPQGLSVVLHLLPEAGHGFPGGGPVARGHGHLDREAAVLCRQGRHPQRGPDELRRPHQTPGTRQVLFASP